MKEKFDKYKAIATDKLKSLRGHQFLQTAMNVLRWLANNFHHLHPKHIAVSYTHLTLSTILLV